MGPCNVEGGAMPAVPTAQLPLDLDLGRQTRELHRYFVVDVFTDTPLEGNQLAVFTDGRPFSSEQMQRLARELNLSETVFILPSQAGGDVHMRIFTPGTELPFAGHPVLGTAFVAGTALGGDVVRLETGLGVVPVELDRQAAVAGLHPDFAALGKLEGIGINCFAGSGSRWKTRMFAPDLGVQEDPATGSAAGPLAVHLARHARIGFGDQIEIRQGAEIRRPSVLYARAEGTADRVQRVRVGGQAMIVARGEFRLD